MTRLSCVSVVFLGLATAALGASAPAKDRQLHEDTPGQGGGWRRLQEDYFSQPGAFQGLAGEKEQELDAVNNAAVQEAFNTFQGTGVGDLTGGGGRRLSWDRDYDWHRGWNGDHRGLNWDRDHDWHRGWNGDHWNRGLNWDDDDHWNRGWNWDVAAPSKNAVKHDVGVEGLGDMAMWGSPAGADMGLWTGGGTEMGSLSFDKSKKAKAKAKAAKEQVKGKAIETKGAAKSKAAGVVHDAADPTGVTGIGATGTTGITGMDDVPTVGATGTMGVTGLGSTDVLGVQGTPSVGDATGVGAP